MRERPPVFRINRNSPLAKGLVFAGLSGGAGTLMLADASGRGNHGTLTNMDPPTDWVWDTTLNRWTLDFDGSNDHVLCPWASIPAGDFSIFAWTYSIDLGTRDIITQWASGQAGRFIFQRTSNYALAVQISGSVVASHANAPVNVWNHVGVTRNGAVLQIYQNGVAVGAAGNSETAIYQTNLRIGTYSGGEYWKGRITDAIIYDRAITPAEIQQLADPSNVLLSGLIADPRRKFHLAKAAGIVFHPWHYRRRRRMTGAA